MKLSKIIHQWENQIKIVNNWFLQIFILTLIFFVIKFFHIDIFLIPIGLSVKEIDSQMKISILETLVSFISIIVPLLIIPVEMLGGRNEFLKDIYLKATNFIPLIVFSLILLLTNIFSLFTSNYGVYSFLYFGLICLFLNLFIIIENIDIESIDYREFFIKLIYFILIIFSIIFFIYYILEFLIKILHFEITFENFIVKYFFSIYKNSLLQVDEFVIIFQAISIIFLVLKIIPVVIYLIEIKNNRMRMSLIKQFFSYYCTLEKIKINDQKNLKFRSYIDKVKNNRKKFEVIELEKIYNYLELDYINDEFFNLLDQTNLFYADKLFILLLYFNLNLENIFNQISKLICELIQNNTKINIDTWISFYWDFATHKKYYNYKNIDILINNIFSINLELPINNLNFYYALNSIYNEIDLDITNNESQRINDYLIVFIDIYNLINKYKKNNKEYFNSWFFNFKKYLINSLEFNSFIWDKIFLQAYLNEDFELIKKLLKIKTQSNLENNTEISIPIEIFSHLCLRIYNDIGNDFDNNVFNLFINDFSYNRNNINLLFNDYIKKKDKIFMFEINKTYYNNINLQKYYFDDYDDLSSLDYLFSILYLLDLLNLITSNFKEIKKITLFYENKNHNLYDEINKYKNELNNITKKITYS